MPNKKDKKILPKDNAIVNEKKEKLNDFALILKDVEEMNKAEQAEKRNYLNIAKNQKYIAKSEKTGKNVRFLCLCTKNKTKKALT